MHVLCLVTIPLGVQQPNEGLESAATSCWTAAIRPRKFDYVTVHGASSSVLACALPSMHEM